MRRSSCAVSLKGACPNPNHEETSDQLTWGVGGGMLQTNWLVIQSSVKVNDSPGKTHELFVVESDERAQLKTMLDSLDPFAKKTLLR